jgi:hypothetical protein
MLCDKCLRLVENGPDVEELAGPTLSEYLSSEHDRPWRIHHAQELDIRRSAEDGCMICGALWEHINRHFLSRDEGWAQPFVVQCPQSDARKAISTYTVIVWTFQIAWKEGGRSQSFIDFHLVPGRFSQPIKLYAHRLDARTRIIINRS